MPMDTYVIDEAAARSDMAKISQAAQLLKQARQAVTQLLSSAEGMQGQTGSAIAEKSQELLHRIDLLTRQLQTSAALLNSTVVHYQQLDTAHGLRIRRGG